MTDFSEIRTYGGSALLRSGATMQGLCLSGYKFCKPLDLEVQLLWNTVSVYVGNLTL